ncbi:hypothetical protein ciss_20160 [Carboxydothermus islandicus]|uniref:Uncharacterized protein n=1 Tax=Carboxydothermus islandicus TaxID=661089 RepID=A0A1L8D4I2_9THEO|nr:hypothetical protein [Carboxydothermus islandicus]GAV26083.1 hypothetical protein ciss_20160 [Carboxydothermus islandicus]
MLIKYNEVIGFYPSLKPGVGEGTIVVMKGGDEVFLRKSIKSFRREILWYYFVDFKALRSMAREFGEPVPLVLGERVFVPLKFRHRAFAGDFCYGYFSLEEIVFCGGKEKAAIILSCGKKYSLACRVKTATTSLIRAKIFRLEISFRK